jgi:hypothetical protein
VWGWTLGRERARDVLAGVSLPTPPDASGDPCAPVLARFEEPTGTALG